MKRRDFLKLVTAGGAACVAAPVAIPNEAFWQHTAYGHRPDGRIGQYHEWRGYVWWIGPSRELRWARGGEPARELDFVYHASHRGLFGFERIAGPVRDQLWLVSEAGWLTFEFDGRPDDDSARLIFRRYHDAT